MIQSIYSTWVGYESLDLFLVIENKTNATIETGAKKMELDSLQPDVMHTICFAGNCYSTDVFVSPMHAFIRPGSNDSSFIAHFLFDNRVHTRGVNHVAYFFYDVAHPADSAGVFVTYNSVAIGNAVKEKSTPGVLEALFPNPANDKVKLPFPGRFELYNNLGEKIEPFSGTFFSAEPSVDLSSIPNGIYYYVLVDGLNKTSGKLLVEHR